MLVQGIKQAITEPPQEEEDCNKTNRIERLPQGQFSSLGSFAVGSPQGPPLPKFLAEHHLDASKPKDSRIVTIGLVNLL